MKAVTIGCLVAMLLGVGAGVTLKPEPARADRPLGPQVIVERPGAADAR